MVAWMGCSIGVYGLSDSNQQVLVYCLGASLLDATLVTVLGYQVLSGLLLARRRLYVYAIVLSALCTVVLLFAVCSGNRAVLAVTAAGTFASVMAVRALSGTAYATLAAFFRAKRARRESVGRV
jgi:hypothetical protein